MKVGVIIEINDPEKPRAAVRFGSTARKCRHGARIFLMGG